MIIPIKKNYRKGFFNTKRLTIFICVFAILGSVAGASIATIALKNKNNNISSGLTATAFMPTIQETETVDFPDSTIPFHFPTLECDGSDNMSIEVARVDFKPFPTEKVEDEKDDGTPYTYEVDPVFAVHDPQSNDYLLNPEEMSNKDSYYRIKAVQGLATTHGYDWGSLTEEQRMKGYDLLADYRYMTLEISNIHDTVYEGECTYTIKHLENAFGNNPYPLYAYTIDEDSQINKIVPIDSFTVYASDNTICASFTGNYKNVLLVLETPGINWSKASKT